MRSSHSGAAGCGAQEMFKTKKSCTFGRSTMAAGRIDVAMTCSEGGGTMNAVTTGTYTATSTSTTTRMTIAGPGAMTIAAVGTCRRVGPC